MSEINTHKVEYDEVFPSLRDAEVVLAGSFCAKLKIKKTMKLKVYQKVYKVQHSKNTKHSHWYFDTLLQAIEKYNSL